MFILTNKDYKIIDKLQVKEIVDEKWIRTSHGSLIQLDMVDVHEVEKNPGNAEYYKDGNFTSHDPIVYEKTLYNYEENVRKLVKLKYPDIEHEIAILRKHIAGIDTKNEFAEYNAYAEQCKTKSKQEFGLI